ncbi:hypothetical protein HELRODRAFT_176473 [Helobdella robusta]|uniref:Methyltransferase FkbM domain-containing protein n=1 Tax=Helobdella robusta TaxID=6412 RepID=T1FAJ5_HELRO|nr:hypothetical protein HELRODRAFT_176473 [Helobdella robusta]ESN99713.1 hypothetical protein HELRODRAFT_176473 [Helobdella robusta]
MITKYRWYVFSLVTILAVLMTVQYIYKSNLLVGSNCWHETLSSAKNTEKSIKNTKKPFNKRLLGYFTYSDQQVNKFNELLRRKADSKDKELIDFVREVMDPPSEKIMVKMSRPLMKTPQTTEIEIILQNKTNGFFVEAGGLDGERSSNSIYLEVVKKWTGLLVEADAFFYTQLMGKNRNSWSINACLGSDNYVSQMTFNDEAGGTGRIVDKNLKSKFTQSSINSVPCFPLQTLLLALNRSHVDYFSLDVEGFEVPILKSFPFDEISISTLSVEYGHGVKTEYTDLMNKNNFHLHKEIATSRPEFGLYVEDYIFVNKNISKLR